MNTNKHLLIIHHSQSGNTEKMTTAIISGARKTDISIRSLSALKATAKDLFWADAVIFGTPENFGYMSGPIKYFFEEIYYECIECTRGLSYALFVAADNDGSGAVSSMNKIITGLGWNNIAEPMICKKGVTSQELESCRELGMTISAGLELGLY